jgi:trans-aconitate 2-methyltransferase
MLSGMPWNPGQYEKFKEQRSAPFDDLLALVEIRPGLEAVDLGCGTGELTRKLADALPAARVAGIDNSAEMLRRATAFARDGLRFELRDVASLDGSYDLIFSNATLHWVSGHTDLFPRLFDRLQSGGQLAVQMPANFDHPSHAILRELASTAFRQWFPRGPHFAAVLPVEQYAEILFHAGAEDIVVMAKVYPHVMPDSDGIVEWTKGTALIPYLEALPAESRDSFLTQYRERLRALFPGAPVFYPFKRILLSARKP